jgi:AraC-like DNA-binding protein
MNSAQKIFADETLNHPHNRFRGVQSVKAEPRSWIKGFPLCRSLDQYKIVHVGMAEEHFPSRMVRTRQTTTYFLACIRGKGRVLIDGNWRVCREGCACLLPAHTLNAYEALAGSPWDYCWVCYQQPPEQHPIGGATAPVMARYNAEPLRHAILGLTEECGDAAQPALIQQWTDLVETYVQRFIKSSNQPDQLRLLWKRVAANPADEWSLTRLAQESGYSHTHLHRLCQSQLGRSPMRQVIYLRMRRAAELLASTSQTIEAVTRSVGYQNPFVFSNTFTKWIGWRPSAYRQRKQGKVPTA